MSAIRVSGSVKVLMRSRAFTTSTWNRQLKASAVPFSRCAQQRSAPSSCQQRYFRATRRALNKRDYYEVLGVSKGVSSKDLKKSYYKLAKEFHPDTNSGDETAAKTFGEISHAYEILSNEEKREKYDTYGHDAEQMGEQADPSEMFRDIFGQMFGGGGGNPFGGGGGNPFGGGGQGAGPSRPQRGSDIQTVLSLSFMEAAKGCSKKLRVRRQGPCEPCDGKGDKPGTKPKVCKKCQGTGVVRHQQGMFQVESYCPHCGGAGKSRTPCKTCGGEGTVGETSQVNVTVPAGVDTSTNLRLAAQGDSGTLGGPRGHLWVQLRVSDHKDFVREGPDVHVYPPVTLSEAVLGGKVSVPTLEGSATVKVRPGIQPGDKVVMRGKGIKSLHKSTFGNQYVHFKINIPTELTSRQRELMEEFQREELGETDTDSGSNKDEDSTGKDENTSEGKDENTSQGNEGDKDDTENKPFWKAAKDYINKK